MLGDFELKKRFADLKEILENIKAEN